MKPGLYYDVPAAKYHADPCPAPSLSASIAHRIRTQSALHAWWHHPALNPVYEHEDSDQFDLGACAHAVLLQGEHAIRWIEAPDWRSKDAKEARKVAREAGKIPVLHYRRKEVIAMTDIARASLHDCPHLGFDIREDGKSEVMAVWMDQGVWCRALIDWLRNDQSYILDYKTTAGSAEPGSWIRRQMIPLGFDLQAAHYSRGIAALRDDFKLPNFVFMVQENYPPYAVSFVALGPAQMQIAEEKRREAFVYFSMALEKGQWRGYPNKIAFAEPTPWELAQYEEMLGNSEHE